MPPPFKTSTQIAQPRYNTPLFSLLIESEAPILVSLGQRSNTLRLAEVPFVQPNAVSHVTFATDIHPNSYSISAPKTLTSCSVLTDTHSGFVVFRERNRAIGRHFGVPFFTGIPRIFFAFDFDPGSHSHHLRNGFAFGTAIREPITSLTQSKKSLPQPAHAAVYADWLQDHFFGVEL